MATLIGTQLKNVLPAYAGMIRKRGGFRRCGSRAPRVCGDDPTTTRYAAHKVACSPRMRG